MVSLTHTGNEGELDKHIAAWFHCQECIEAWDGGLCNIGKILGFCPSQWSFPSTHCISKAAATPGVQLTPLLLPNKFSSPLNRHLEVVF